METLKYSVFSALPYECSHMFTEHYNCTRTETARTAEYLLKRTMDHTTPQPHQRAYVQIYCTLSVQCCGGSPCQPPRMCLLVDRVAGVCSRIVVNQILMDLANGIGRREQCCIFVLCVRQRTWATLSVGTYVLYDSACAATGIDLLRGCIRVLWVPASNNLASDWTQLSAIHCIWDRNG